MNTTEQQAFDAMREALEIAEKHLAYVEIFEALSAAKAVSSLTNRYTEKPQGDAKADCLCGRDEFCPDCEPGLFGEVQPTITNSESRSPIAHLRARTSQNKWNSYELCQADDPNGIAVYAHPQASKPQDADPNAPWLTKAHMLCTDHGVPQGNIEWRLEVLRGVFENPQASEPAPYESHLRHRLRVHLANRGVYSKAEFIDKVEQWLAETAPEATK